MSGIACVFHSDGRPADPALIHKMTQAMAYRGPDGIAHRIEGALALGHCQLHTTTESLEERQPLASPDSGHVLVMDGYLANCDELRAELLQRGARLRDRSDAELVLRAYEQWGEDCPRHIDGEYAFVIWDAARREVFFARDHQGLRPLVYHFDGTRLLVASDIAAIVAALGQLPPVNLGYTAEFMANVWYSTEETVWQGIMRLPPAHSMRVGQQGLVPRKYWSVPLEVRIRYRSEGEYAEHYRAVFTQCLTRAARSHRPLGFEVSGGLDSSALFGMADQMQRQGRLPAPDLAGYTLDTEPGTRSDEMRFVRAVERQTSRPITRVPIFSPDFAWTRQQARQDRDFPIFPNTFMLIGLAERMASVGSRVIINGQGGDVWLGGSQAYYREALTSFDLPGLAYSLKADVAALGLPDALSLFARRGLFDLLPDGFKTLVRSRRPARTPDPLDSHDWLSRDMRDELIARKARFEQAHSGIPPRQLYKVRKHGFPFNVLCLEMMARLTARTGTEYRAPFMARQFIEFSCETPEWIRLRGGVAKYIHRLALADVLPPEVVQRRDKAIFDPTFTRYENAVRQFCLETHTPVFESMIERPVLEQFFEAYCNAAIDEGAIWEIWGNYVGAAIARMPNDIN